MKTYFVPAKTDIELTGSTKPTYNGYLSLSYFEGADAPHYGMDLVAGMYTAIGSGEVIYVNPTNVGGGIVVKHEWTENHDLFALYWHGKPLANIGQKVSENDYLTDSRIPDASLGSLSKHTHFEIRIVEKGRPFVYNDQFRQYQAIEPMCILQLRSNSVIVGNNLKNYLAYRGIDISPKTEPSAADVISKLSGDDIKKAILNLMN